MNGGWNLSVGPSHVGPFHSSRAPKLNWLKMSQELVEDELRTGRRRVKERCAGVRVASRDAPPPGALREATLAGLVGDGVVGMVRLADEGPGLAVVDRP